MSDVSRPEPRRASAIAPFWKVLPRPWAESGPNPIALGAAALIALEIFALFLAWAFDPLLAVAVAGGVVYAALCWVSLPVAWLLALAAVPFAQEMTVPGIGSLWVPSEPMFLLFLFMWGIRALLHGSHRILASPMLARVGLLALLAVLSSLQSAYPILSIKAVISTAWFVAFAFLYPYVQAPDVRIVRWGVRLIAGAATVFALYGLIFVATHGVARWTGNAMGRPFFPEHGTYSSFLCFGLALVLAITFSKPGHWRRILGLGAASLITLAVLLSLARAAYLALAGSLLVWSWFLLRAGRARTLVAMAVVAGVSLAGLSQYRAAGFVQLYTGSIAQPNELSNIERIGRWLAAWNMVRDRPILGVGYGAYPDSYFSYRVITLKTEERFRRMGVHSDYFKILSEMGWLGFAALVALLITVFRQAAFAARRAVAVEDRWLAVGALAGLTSHFIHAFFNDYTGIDKLSTPLWFLLGAVAVLSIRARQQITPQA